MAFPEKCNQRSTPAQTGTSVSTSISTPHTVLPGRHWSVHSDSDQGTSGVSPQNLTPLPPHVDRSANNNTTTVRPQQQSTAEGGREVTLLPCPHAGISFTANHSSSHTFTSNSSSASSFSDGGPQGWLDPCEWKNPRYPHPRGDEVPLEGLTSEQRRDHLRELTARTRAGLLRLREDVLNISGRMVRAFK